MKTIWKKQLTDPPKHYRPMPFWSWNTRLDAEETRHQIALMDDAGLGGYFMHARNGLQTPYMGAEWMVNIRTGLEQGAARGMEAWGYDENGWPSGFAAGAVNGLGEEYQQKYLRWERADAAVQTPHTIACVPFEGRFLHFYYEINPYYVDLLDPRVTESFLAFTHIRYREELGEDFSRMAGFFTDEPQLSRAGIPWSAVLPEAYQTAYGEALPPLLPELYFETGCWRQTRVRFWQLVRDLFTDNFMQPLHRWCRENGMRLTGHMLLEETLGSQLTCNSACMPCYEYFDIPGMDCLTRGLIPASTPLQVSSVAHQLGKKQVLSELYAACGWNVSFEEMRWLAEHQLVRGVTLLCPHLEGYSLRGMRKRDYPATLYFQQPWWPEYRQLLDMLSRIGMLLTEGEVAFDVLLLHPQSTAWMDFNYGENPGLSRLEQDFVGLLDALDDRQVRYHLGDERIIARHGRVEADRFCVGTQRYRVVLVPPCDNLSGIVWALLKSFAENGGCVIWHAQSPTLVDGVYCAELAAVTVRVAGLSTEKMVAAVPADCRVPVTVLSGDSHQLAATTRRFGDTVMTYLVNSAPQRRCVQVQLSGRNAAVLDYATGRLQTVACEEGTDGLYARLWLEPCGSTVLFDGERGEAPAALPASASPLPLSACWELTATQPNALTLDLCDCWFDGELMGENIPVIDVQEMACALERPVELELTYRFFVEDIPETVELVTETPEQYRIFLNGEELQPCIIGTYLEDAFKRLALPPLKKGENSLRLCTRFAQSPQTYAAIRRARQFESEKNKLCYDMELEAVYLLGDFAVTAAPFTALPRQASQTDGGFTLTHLPETVRSGDLVRQGFPFFAGRLTLSQTVRLTGDQLHSRVLTLARRGACVTAVRVNGRPAGQLLWAPYTLSLDGLLVEGDNRIEVELTGTLRNLFGPHHLGEETYCAGPHSFFRCSPLWVGGNGRNRRWTPSYCFADFGVYTE